MAHTNLKKYLFLSIFFLLFSMSIDDVQDTLVHHYDRSVFAENSFMYPDWTRKYVDGKVELGRKTFLGVTIPAAFFDGWHLLKLVRYLFIYFAVWFMYLAYNHQRFNNGMVRFALSLSIYIIAFAVLHWLLYSNLLLI